MQELTVTAQRVRAKMRRYASYRGLPGFVALLLAMWYLHSTWRVSKSLPDITPSAVGAIRELVTQPPHKFVVIAGTHTCSIRLLPSPLTPHMQPHREYLDPRCFHEGGFL